MLVHTPQIDPVGLLERLGLAQVPTVPSGYSSAPALWSQLVTALVVGLLIAFGLQILLTNLGIALGISALSHRFSAAHSPSDQELPNETESEQVEEDTDRRHSGASWVGAGILLVMNVVLFSACFLAAKFTHTAEPASGAIVGITIWSAYLLILIWVSTRTLNSVTGFLFDRATGGLRQIITTITNALQSDDNETDAISVADLPTLIQQEVRQALSSTEMRHFIATQLHTVMEGTIVSPTYPDADYDIAATEAEMTSLPTRSDELPQLWQPLKTYLAETPTKKLTTKTMARKLPALLQTIQEQMPADRPFPPLPLAELTDQLTPRPDLSDKKKQRILQQIEATWTELAADRPVGTPSELPDSTAVESPESESLPQSGQDTSSDSSNSLTSVLSSETLQRVVEQALRYTITHLPDGLQESKSAVPYAIGATLSGLSTALDHLKDSNALPESLSLDVTDLKPYLNRLIQAAPASLSDLGTSSIHHAEQLRDLALQPLESIQQNVQAQVDRVQQQARERAEATRRAAAKATWWLFTTAATSALAAALAGALASGLTLPEWWTG